VHDLVDFVSIESEIAGRMAAQYAEAPTHPDCEVVRVHDGPGVRGTVPQIIRRDATDAQVTLQFRPDTRYGACYIEVYEGEIRIARAKRAVLTPGEMVEIKVPRALIHADITVKVSTIST